MIDRMWCRLTGGHYWIRVYDHGRAWLQCMNCPARTRGWSVNP